MDKFSKICHFCHSLLTETLSKVTAFSFFVTFITVAAAFHDHLSVIMTIDMTLEDNISEKMKFLGYFYILKNGIENQV